MIGDQPWARTTLAQHARDAIISGVFRPLVGAYTRRTVIGREHLDGLDGPVVFVASHASHMDTPLILGALPAAWRRRTSVAAAADYFYGKRSLAMAVSLAFSTVPVQRGGQGTLAEGGSLLDRLIATERRNLVLYAEGTRSRTGSVGKLRSGAAVLAARHDVPLVPVHVDGTDAAMPVGNGWAKRADDGSRHDVTIAFGPPLDVGGVDGRADAMERVREFFASHGAATTPHDGQAQPGAAPPAGVR
ncbi:MAG: lysophospholipid acyltransferase family protein [Solirubrobacterales bacterium]